MKITVFCSANEHIDPEYFRLTEELGKWMAENHHDLIFGGTNQGLMNCVAKAVHEGGGRVIGVVPSLVEKGGRMSDYLDVHMEYSQRLQLTNFLVMIAQADGSVPQSEIDALQFIAASLGISEEDLASMLNLSTGATNIDAAYKVLGITPDATDDEVKAAYRRMALKHHPDRVATLGEDVRKAAEKKFQEINAAKETIYKARGL